MSDGEKLIWLVAMIACPFAVLLMPCDCEKDERYEFNSGQVYREFTDQKGGKND